MMHGCSQMASVPQYQFKSTRPWLLCCMVHLLAQVGWHIVGGACIFSGNGVPKATEAYTCKAHIVLNVSDGGHLYVYMCNANISMEWSCMYTMCKHIQRVHTHIFNAHKCVQWHVSAQCAVGACVCNGHVCMECAHMHAMYTHACCLNE